MISLVFSFGNLAFPTSEDQICRNLSQHLKSIKSDCNHSCQWSEHRTDTFCFPLTFMPIGQVAVEVWVRNLALRCLCIFFGGHSARLLLWTCRWATEGCRPLQTFCFWNFFNLLQALLRHPLAFSLSTLKPPSPLPLSLLRLSAFQRPLSAVISPFPLAVVLAALLLLPLLPLRCTWFLALVLTSNFLTMTFQHAGSQHQQSLEHTALSKKQSLKGTYSHSIPTQSCSDEEAETSVISRLTGMVRIGIWQRQAQNLQIFPWAHWHVDWGDRTRLLRILDWPIQIQIRKQNTEHGISNHCLWT